MRGKNKMEHIAVSVIVPYLYPIPQAEIVKSGGVLDQNPGW